MQGRSFGRTILIAASVLLLVLLVARRKLLTPVQDLTTHAFSPIVRVATTIQEGLGGSLQSFVRVRRLSRAVRILEQEKMTLTARIARLEGIEQENTVLREQLRLLPRKTLKLVTGDVVSPTTDGVTDGLIINRGAQDGITEGRPVIVNEGIVIGRIHTVRSSSAVIALLADPSFRVGAETQASHAEGLLHGVRGIDLIFDTIPRTSTVRVGDRVMTNGTDGIFPPHLLLGTIQSIEAPGNEIFQSARILPLLDVHAISIVSVVLP